MKLKSNRVLPFGENDSAFCGPTMQSLQIFFNLSRYRLGWKSQIQELHSRVNFSLTTASERFAWKETHRRAQSSSTNSSAEAGATRKSVIVSTAVG